MEEDEVVGLIRKVQADFGPHDSRGWDAVAVLVRGVGYTGEDVCAMGYPELCAIFRTSAFQMRLQKTGSLNHGIATATSSIVPLDVAPTAKPHRKPRGETAAERMQELFATVEGKTKLASARTSKGVGLIIGKSKSAVVGAGPIWDVHVGPFLQSMRVLPLYFRNTRGES